MDIHEFRRVLTAFADEPSDVDISIGKVVAQIRDEVIDASISYANDDHQMLMVHENDQAFPARSWLVNRVARLPQLADRIFSNTAVAADDSGRSPFVVPSGTLTRDLSESIDSIDEEHVPSAVDVLLERVSRPLPGATSVIYLTSDAGEGKTTLIGRTARIQAKLFKDKKVGSLIVPIPLNGRAFLNFDDAVIAALVNKLRFNYFYYDGFLQLVRMGVVIPAFDGYEEMLVEGSRGEAVSALGNLVQQLESSGMVVVAARKAFFDYLSFKTQARLLDAIGDRSASFSRLALCRWSKEQFCEYGAARSISNAEEVYEIVAARLGSEHPLLTRAVLVKRLFDVIEAGADERELADLLGTRPHDYFFTFVDAILKREAAEKWLAKVSGDVMTPLLEIHEHHQLLSLIAQEMWMSSSNSLRHDVLDVVVDIFGESLARGPAVVRQIKERVKQHSLLSSESGRVSAITFDHEDFYNFYLGESLGHLLVSANRPDIQTFLSVAPVPQATIEQAVQYAVRHNADNSVAFMCIAEINAAESGFTFCKENCSSLALRLSEVVDLSEGSLEMKDMIFPQGCLASRTLSGVKFIGCQFQPTSVSKSRFMGVNFQDCDFERIECDLNQELTGCSFEECRVESLISSIDGEQTFDPNLIDQWMERAGAIILREGDGVEDQVCFEIDDRIRLLERFFRIFLRSTHVDEDVIRLRLGKVFVPVFFESVLSDLIDNEILEDVPWRGAGFQHRYKLIASLTEIERCLEKSNGRYENFVRLIKKVK